MSCKRSDQTADHTPYSSNYEHGEIPAKSWRCQLHPNAEQSAMSKDLDFQQARRVTECWPSVQRSHSGRAEAIILGTETSKGCTEETKRCTHVAWVQQAEDAPAAHAAKHRSAAAARARLSTVYTAPANAGIAGMTDSVHRLSASERTVMRQACCRSALNSDSHPPPSGCGPGPPGTSAWSAS
jgi:hypothetical protein